MKGKKLHYSIFTIFLVIGTCWAFFLDAPLQNYASIWMVPPFIGYGFMFAFKPLLLTLQLHVDYKELMEEYDIGEIGLGTRKTINFNDFLKKLEGHPDVDKEVFEEIKSLAMFGYLTIASFVVFGLLSLSMIFV